MDHFKSHSFMESKDWAIRVMLQKCTNEFGTL